MDIKEETFNRIADSAAHLFYIEEQADTMTEAVEIAAREIIIELGPCIQAARAHGWEEAYNNDTYVRELAYSVLDDPAFWTTLLVVSQSLVS